MADASASSSGRRSNAVGAGMAMCLNSDELAVSVKPCYNCAHELRKL